MSDESSFTAELTRRQEEILSLIVRAYTQTPEPISSKYIVDTYNPGFSSATIRNEMARLEELGYISAPHTSAGRIPTAKGYRYFVRHLIPNGDLSEMERSHIAEKFNTAPIALEQWMIQAATVLARAARTASLITPPITETSRFQHCELIALQGRLVLMVLVLQGGTVQQRMLTLAEPVSQAALSEIAARLNLQAAGLLSSEVRVRSVQMPFLEREIMEIIAEMIDRAHNYQVRSVYRDGLGDMIHTFHDTEGAQQAVRLFEERHLLNVLLTEVFSPLINEDEIQVLIAGEGRWQELSHLSMVLGRYGLPGRLSGTVGVLGPTHLNYGRSISAVRYVSSLMTNMLVSLYQSTEAPSDTGDHDTGEAR